MASSLVAMLFMQFSAYAKNPTLTKTNAVFNKELEFPAVTICNLNMFNKHIVNCTGHQNSDDMFDLFKQMSDVAVLARVESQPQTGVPLSGEVLRQCAIDYSNQLKEFLTVCIWEGMVKNCSDVFQGTITDYGMCYTFNKENTLRAITGSTGADSGIRILVNIKQDDYFFSRTTQAGIKVGMFLQRGRVSTICVRENKVLK